MNNPKCKRAWHIVMLLAVPLCSNASEVKGVWQGTLGKTEIIACFNSDKSGSYYDLHDLLPIQLRSKQGGGWSEYSAADLNRGQFVPNGSQWSLLHVSDDGLDGDWSSPNLPHVLPIELTRLTSDYRRSLPSVVSSSNLNGEQPCGSDAYNERLEFLPPVQFGPMEEFEGKQFRRVLAGNVETIELSGQSQGIVRVNVALRKELPLNKTNLRWYFASRRDGLGRDGWAYESFTRAQPIYWSDDWISLRFRWVNPASTVDIIDQYRTWDMRSGKEVDPWTWFGTHSYRGTSQQIAGYSEELPPELARYLREYVLDLASGGGEECQSDFDSTGYYLVIEHEGLRFLATSGFCDRPSPLIPYSELKPFLTKSGAVAVRRIVQAHPRSSLRQSPPEL